jgi:hypothetical protein
LCDKRFIPDDLSEHSAVTATRAGGALTGSVTAKPIPSIVALAGGALAWLIRALELFRPVDDPRELFALPAVLFLATASVWRAFGPAKHLPALLGLVSAGAALIWPTKVAFHDAAFVTYGVVLVAATMSEPSTLRLSLGSAVACAAAMAGVVALIPQRERVLLTPEAVSLQDDSGRLRWLLPAGWQEAGLLSGAVLPEAKPHRTLLRAQGEESTAMLLRDEGAAGLCSELGALVPDLKKSRDEVRGVFSKGTHALQGPSAVVACIEDEQGGVAIMVFSSQPDTVRLATLRVLASGVTMVPASR